MFLVLSGFLVETEGCNLSINVWETEGIMLHHSDPNPTVEGRTHEENHVLNKLDRPGQEADGLQTDRDPAERVQTDRVRGWRLKLGLVVNTGALVVLNSGGHFADGRGRCTAYGTLDLSCAIVLSDSETDRQTDRLSVSLSLSLVCVANFCTSS